MAQHQGNRRFVHLQPPSYEVVQAQLQRASRSDGSDNLGPRETYGTLDQETLLPKRSAPQYSHFFLVFVFLATFATGFISNELIASRQHESLRRQWADTEGKWKSDLTFMENERSRWANERAAQKEQEANQRKAQKEKETSQRSRIAWVGLDADQQCLRYGTREYTATLANVPLGFDAISECQKKPIIIHGKPWFPDRCEDQGICGQVTGHWTVNSDEPVCRPWWDDFKDKGCMNGARVYDAHLQYLQQGDDWKAMCSTTPTIIKGKYFARPVSCVDWGKNGIGGVWHLPDSSCQRIRI
ncbi:hypothetical protein GALMADRAFT_257615 [Galerina marginata CBS 339.88]|uniref:Uncharacterized protein n=1 Tax=Galerina marginata (strain CBS 339.88) TaxID=685588 RepID=A0A067SCR6_GALM3|nr:hypothetical protein GALMADRAFT_257615 [Galerina marginata CBS 339.88]